MTCENCKNNEKRLNDIENLLYCNITITRSVPYATSKGNIDPIHYKEYIKVPKEFAIELAAYLWLEKVGIGIGIEYLKGDPIYTDNFGGMMNQKVNELESYVTSGSFKQKMLMHNINIAELRNIVIRFKQYG